MMAGVVAMAAVIEDFDTQVFPVRLICLQRASAVAQCCSSHPYLFPYLPCRFFASRARNLAKMKAVP